MIPTQGVNHLALSVADMKRTLEFYTGVLGLRLLGLFPMHGVPGASFKGPDGEQLEVTYQTRPLGAEKLDAETFRALGISAEERAGMTR